jgi:hypothetical protein
VAKLYESVGKLQSEAGKESAAIESFLHGIDVCRRMGMADEDRVSDRIDNAGSQIV